MPVVLIAGGSGLIGTNLTRHLIERNYDVRILSRGAGKSSENPNISYAHWDVEKREIDIDAIKEADHMVHLAGAGVMDNRWTEPYKKQILESRTKTSSLLIEALTKTSHKLISFVSASGIGWYGEDSKPLIRSEGFIETDPADNSFLGETCRLWEASVAPVARTGARVIKLRTGIVLSNDGGAYKELTAPLKFGIAGILAGGKQVLSWIHIDDLCRIYIEAIENGDMNGTYNAVAPKPVTNKKLMLEAADSIRKKFYVPVHVPAFALKLFLGERAAEVLKSATVSNQKIKLTGFTFLYPTIEAAVEELTGS